MPANPAHQRQHVLYRGHVQGVGFRFTAHAIAKRYDVTGFVRNLADGQVELVAEGEKHELAAFLDDIRTRLANYIREERIDEPSATGEFTCFEIRH